MDYRFVRSRAFVLNASAGNGKIILLDEHYGRIDVRLSFYARAGKAGMQLPATGYLIEWSGRKSIDNIYVLSSELVVAPALWVRQDILFMHHVCELCCIWLPPAQGMQDVYPLLLLLYACRSAENGMLYKKMFLYNMVSLLGLHPDDSGYDPESLFDLFLFPLISSDGNSMFDFQEARCDGYPEKKLTLKLCRALQHAHDRSPLKTFSFVKRLGVAL